jgi:2-dehydro-3-deoxyphosphogluconate aldolase/(4S)-4-hydroxy-2-oxoglutarate aldolase
MSKKQVRERIEEIGIVPAIRVSHAEDAIFAAQTVANSGIPIAEITMTVPGALEVITELASNPGMIVGAGTIWDVETATRCVKSGASFLTSTGFDLDVVRFAVKENVVVFPGTLTPTEVMQAWKRGPDFVKVFPCASVGGPAYIKALKQPFPTISLIASDCVTQNTVADSFAPERPPSA